MAASKRLPRKDPDVVRWFTETAAKHRVPIDQLPTCDDFQNARLERFERLRRQPR